MEDAENRLIAEPAPIDTDQLEGQRCKYAEKSYLYKYDLGHISECSCKSVVAHFVKLGVQSVRERESERGRCLLVVTAACGEREEDKRSLPLWFSSILYSSHIVYLTACGLSWFFPPSWVFHVISCVSSYLCFLSLITCKHPRFGCGRTT